MSFGYAFEGGSFGFSDAAGRLGEAWEVPLKRADAFVKKATAALFEAETVRAELYVGKAAAIPFVEEDAFFPGVWQAEYRLADFVLGLVEETPTGDETWLRVLGGVMGDSGDIRTALLGALSVVVREGDLSKSERKRARALLEGAPAFDLDKPAHDPNLSEAERGDRIEAAITALIAYAAAMEVATGG